MPHIEPLAAILPELAPPADFRISGLDSDSRRLQKNMLFVGLENRHGDARQFLGAAWAAGAGGALLEGSPATATADHGRPVWIRPDARQLLGLGLRRWHAWDHGETPTIIGITGTNGKSSVAWLLAQLAPAPAHLVGTLGYGCPGAREPLPNTTPEAVTLWELLDRSRRAGATAVAMEVSSHALALGRVAAIPFGVGIFLNLSQDHLDFHGDMEHYGQAKARLFDTPEMRLAILNAEDPLGQALSAGLAGKMEIRRFGFSAGDYRIQEYHPGASGTFLVLETPHGRRQLRSPFLGRSNASNLLAALACADSLGWSTEDAQIAGLSLPPGRYQRLEPQPGRPQVLIDYAHTPDALERVLADLRDVAKGQVTVVFGCGGERDPGKRPQMGAIAARLADRTIVTDDNPRGENPEHIVGQILSGMPAGAAAVQHDRRSAIRSAIAGAAAGDWVLIAGKGHETFQDTAGQRLPFSDAETAREALQTC